jgi:hypothetical protein
LRCADCRGVMSSGKKRGTSSCAIYLRSANCRRMMSFGMARPTNIDLRRRHRGVATHRINECRRGRPASRVSIVPTDCTDSAIMRENAGCAPARSTIIGEPEAAPISSGAVENMTGDRPRNTGQIRPLGNKNVLKHGTIRAKPSRKAGNCGR